MATIAELIVKIGANGSGLRKELAATQRQIKRTFGSESLGVSQNAVNILGGVTAGLIAAGVASISLAGKIRLTQKAFETLTGSAETSKNMITELKALDDKSAFSFDTYAKGAQKLLALGIAADKVIPTLTTIGDASAALGQGEEGIDRIVLALSQMTAKGKVSAQEMNQLAENNVQGWRYLSDAMGISIAEVMKKAEDGAINGTAAVEVILKGMEKDFKGSMDRMADETPIVWSTIVSSAQQILAGIGPALDESLDINKTLIKVRDYLVDFKKSIDEIGVRATFEAMVPPGVSVAIIALSGAIVGSAIPALVSLATAAATALVSLWPYIAVGAAVGLTIAAIASATKDQSTAMERQADAAKKEYTSLKSLTDEYEDLEKNTKKTADEKKRMLDVSNKIAELAPDLVKYHDDEGNAILDLTGKQEALNRALEKELRLRQKAKKKRVDSAKDDLADLEERRSLIQDQLARVASRASVRYTDKSMQEEYIKKESAELNAALRKINADIDKAEAKLKSLTTPKTKPTSKPDPEPDPNPKKPPLDNGKGKLKEIENEVKRITEAIEREWVQVTMTEQEQLDIWYEDQVAALEKTKGINKNYLRDMERLNAAYDAKSKAIDEAKIESAKRTSEAIEREWVQTTNSELEQLDLWKNEQLIALEETKDANGDYQRDIERVEAVYSARRRKIVQEEQDKINQIMDQATDRAMESKRAMESIGLKGVDRQKFDIETDAIDKIESIKREYRDWASEYVTATDAQREQFRKAWEANGIQFTITEQGMVDFSKQIAAEQVAIEQQKNQDIADLHYERVKLQQELDEAYNEGHIQRYTELLAEEQALQAQDLEARQEMMDTYYDIWQESHRTAMSYMAEATNGVYSGLEGFFVDIINNAKSIGDAWQGLKKTILTMLGQMVAKWVASKIMMSVLNKTALATETAVSTAAAATTAAAWAPAAAMVSLASFGANAAPAMAGISSTYGLSMGLASIPMLADGGITTGPSLAMIGEGKYQEAVLPLNKRAFEKAGLTGEKQQPQQPLVLQPILQFLDPSDADNWLERGGGKRIVKYLKNELKEFAPVG